MRAVRTHRPLGLSDPVHRHRVVLGGGRGLHVEARVGQVEPLPPGGDRRRDAEARVGDAGDRGAAGTGVVQPEHVDRVLLLLDGVEDPPEQQQAVAVGEFRRAEVDGAGGPGARVDAHEAAAVSDDEVKRLATLPPADVLRAQFAGAVAAPLTTIVGLFTAPLRDLVNVLDARIKQLEEQGETVEPEPEAVTTAEEPKDEVAEPPTEEEPSEETTAGGETASPETEEEE